MLILMLLVSFVASKKKILLSPGNYMKGHSAPFVVLAKRLAKDPAFDCYVVAEPEFKDLWKNVNCTMLFIHPNNEIEKNRMLQESQIENSEKGISKALEELKFIVTYSFPFWEKADMFKKIQEIGIDMAICDPFNTQCATAVHRLNIPKNVYMFPACYPGVFSHVHGRDANRIPFDTMNWKNDNIGFFDRLLNSFKLNIFDFIKNRLISQIAREYVPSIESNDWRSNTLYKREGLYVLPCVPYFNFPEELPPNYIHSGPLVDREFKPLPEAILAFISQYDQVIYVSFGSLSINYDLTKVINLAQKLPNFGFVISYPKQYIDNDSALKNCLILTWVPQNDLLASGKVSLFITHSGWNSFSQALLYGVPMVTCGWSVDRVDSSYLAELRKVGKAIPSKDQFTVDNLLKITQEILADPSYKQNSLKYSKMLQKWDSEGKIIEAIHLYFEMGIENLVMENYYDLYWFQRNSLDLLMCGLIVFIIVVFTIFKLGKMFWKNFCNRIVKTKEKKN